MFDMKNENMDDLFRKAAENYELDTSGASDWDAVNNALRNADTLSEEGNKEKKKKRRLFFWWFLVLPAAWIGHNAWEKAHSNAGIHTAAIVYPVNGSEKETTVTSNNPQSSNDAMQKSVGVAANNSSAPLVGTKDDSNTTEEKKNDERVVSNSNKQKENTAQENNLAKKSNKPSVKDAEKSIASSDVLKKNFPLENDKKVGTEKNSKIFFKKNKTTNNQKQLLVVGNRKSNNKNSPSNSNTKTGVSFPYEDYHKDITGNLQNVSVGYDSKAFPVISTGKINVDEAMQVERFNSTTNADSAAQQKSKEPQPHYFYVAAVASPDLSFVKFQRLSGTGSSFGLVVGYRFNKRWHVEAGAMLEKKVYYTKGAYFDKSKLSNYYQNVDMISVDGSCHMITIPVNLRYNIYAGKKINWFVAGGMSSYLMSEEYYSYTYKHYGGSQIITRGYDYKTSEKNWMTVINLNVGYERTFLRSFNLRVEPYFRIPVAGVGTGNLSLTSGGVFVGIGKRF